MSASGSADTGRLNHVSNFKSLETLAHEMGHAIHAERSKQRTTFYEGHSTVTCWRPPVALFENLVLDVVYKQASVTQKLCCYMIALLETLRLSNIDCLLILS